MLYFSWCTLSRALAWAACIAFLIACEGSSPIVAERPADPLPPQPRPPVVVDAAIATPDAGPIGEFRFTMYYVAIEPEPEDGDDGEDDEGDADSALLASTSGLPDGMSGEPDTVTLYKEKGCRPIAEVDRAFARQLMMQGTGKLADGRVLNTSGRCRCKRSPCFKEIDALWALGAGGGLAPFRSAAVDTRIIPLGSLLYVPELDGVRVPGRAPWGGYVHDGCIVADDRGGGIRGYELDLFVAKKSYLRALYKRTRLEKVTIFDGSKRCERRPGGRIRAARDAT